MYFTGLRIFCSYGSVCWIEFGTHFLGNPVQSFTLRYGGINANVGIESGSYFEFLGSRDYWCTGVASTGSVGMSAGYNAVTAIQFNFSFSE
jgi:hypothetical protein